ncbi:MAG: hypothetical protein ABJC89_02525 [Acidobacteriota bacterium]
MSIRPRTHATPWTFRRSIAIGVFLGLAYGHLYLHAQVVDRILAVVDGGPITQSDVAAAIRLRLVRPAPGGDPVSSVLDRLIERHLMLAEVERYAPPEPAEAAVESRLGEIRSQVGPLLEPTLQQTGLSADQLRRHLRDDLRIDTYLQQRFGAIVPSEPDILQYYRTHAADFPQTAFDQAHDRALAALVAERRAATIGEWVAGLRRRANINVLPRRPDEVPVPGSGPPSGNHFEDADFRSREIL